MPRKSLLYYLTHWYTFRTVVGVLLGALIAVLVFGAYPLQLFPIHPEDRILSGNDAPDPNVVIVGIDDASIRAVGHFPFSRDRFATALDNLHRAGATVTVFDIGFSEGTNGSGDDQFATAIGKDGPVVLAYSATTLDSGNPYYAYANTGDTNRPLDKFVCGNPKAVPGCQPVAEMGSTTVLFDADNVVRRVPMFLQAPCVEHGGGSCPPATHNPSGSLPHRQLLGSPSQRQSSPEGATFGPTWAKPLPVDNFGTATIGWSGGPGYMKAHGQYLSFSDVYNNNFERAKVDNRAVLIGIYKDTGVHDELQFAPAGPDGGSTMYGVRTHSNLIQMLNARGPSNFLPADPPVAGLLRLPADRVLHG